MFGRGLALGLIGALTGLAIGCRSGGELADLVELHGAAEHDLAAAPEKWDKASVGESFRAGDALRTARASDAYVRLRRGGGLKLGPESVVRFRGPTAGPARPIGIESGEAEIEAGSDSLEFDMRLGRARIEAGGRLRVNASSDRTQFEVLVGQTILEGDGGDGMKLARGEKISLDIGGAILERTTAPVDVPAAVVDTKPDPESADAGALGMTIKATVEGGGAQVQDRGKPWAPLDPGDADIAPGSRIRVPKGSSVSVKRGNERASIHGAAEAIVGGPGGALVNTVEGDVAVDAEDGEVRIEVPGGTIIARQGSRAGAAVRRGKPTEVHVEKGEVEVRGKNKRNVLAAGQSTSLDRGGDVDIEEFSRVDFSMNAGESAMVHDPNAPTGVRIQFAGVCSGEGEVEFSGSARKKGARSRGSGSAPILAGPGVNRYRLRCVDDDGPGDVKAQGAISVAKDSGAAQLPRKAPQNMIDADGRRYTVMYQNLLPQITVSWPSAPQGKTFILHVEPERGTARTVDAKTAIVKFPSGSLGEGTHAFWFEIQGDAVHRSPKTTLRIDFDNAAPAAHIQEPPAGAPISGTVTVAGVALEGATVSVSGVDIPLDGQFRFRDQASAKPGESSLAIRIVHPKHGVHYYLRRLQKGEP